MKKYNIIIIFLLTISFIFIGCSRKVHETREYYTVDSNVKYAPPIKTATKSAPTQPTEPTQPVQPVQPTEPTQPIQPTEPTQPIQPTEPTQPIQPTEPTQPDWINKTLIVIGQCAVNPAHTNPAQARLMAKRGAILDAKRQLLEQVLGLRLDSQTSVKDMVTESDRINAETSGLIKDCQIIGEHFDGSIYSVKMELKLYDVYQYIQQNK